MDAHRQSLSHAKPAFPERFRLLAKNFSEMWDGFSYSLVGAKANAKQASETWFNARSSPTPPALAIHREKTVR